MKYIRGFFMAWGMFCWIPCPYKQWHEDARKAQLAMLPVIGGCIGGILCLVWWLLTAIGAGSLITGAILTGVYFLMTGFIHLDGFMDCNDAIMPRHADMETRVRILKDSHAGAFAVICLGLMLVLFAGSMAEAADDFSIITCRLVIQMFIISRFMAAVFVLASKPMTTSQYAAHEGSMKDTLPALIVFAIIMVVSEILTGGLSSFSVTAEVYADVTGIVVMGTAALTGYIDKKVLGGMNGDIAGHMITTSEMFGVIALAFLMS